MEIYALVYIGFNLEVVVYPPQSPAGQRSCRTMRWSAVALVLCIAVIAAEEDLPWWRTAVFYQVYQRSFKDSDGDGIGDLKGVTQMAGYIKEIGVDAIWLCPINKSPMRDFGYDISDFGTVDPLYGSIEDFEEMMATYRALGIKVVLDFVPNHTSDQHVWFQASSNTSHPLHEYYRDFYVWKPANGTTAEGKPLPPNNWTSVFSGPAWQWVEDRQMFYLHQFAKEQPDLDYRNPNVVSNMTAIFQFWLDKGVDGFRMDASKFIFENASFPNEPPVPGTSGDTYDNMQHFFDTDQPETFQLLSQWTDMVHDRVLQDGRPRALFNEVYDPLDMVMKYYGTGNRTMQITFNFGLVERGGPSAQPRDLKEAIDLWMEAMPKNAVANWVIGNHDHLRTANTYGSELVDAITILTGVLPGVKCVYYGEEIGMEDAYILWNQTVDPRGRLVGPAHYTEQSRDPERTPMQWDNSTSAGFSINATTWLPVNPNYWWLNVAAQRAAPVSHLKVFQTLNKARKDPVLQRGDLQVLVPNEHTLLVIRRYNGSHFAFIVNMGSDIVTYTSQNLFGLNGIDVDMTVVVASINSGYSPGTNMRQGFVNVTLRPKAAILLRSGTSTPAASSASTASTGPLTSAVLLLAIGVLRQWAVHFYT